MGDGTGLTAVRPERECVHSPVSVEQWNKCAFRGAIGWLNSQRT